jgi:hypothetical protein
MNDLATKQNIVKSLAEFDTKPLAEAATALFESLGYKSQKLIVLTPNSAVSFAATFAEEKPLNPETAILADWQSVDFLFQLTDDEVRAAAQGSQQFLFDSQGKWDGAAMESFFFCHRAVQANLHAHGTFRHHPCGQPAVSDARDALVSPWRHAHAGRYQPPVAQTRRVQGRAGKDHAD